MSMGVIIIALIGLGVLGLILRLFWVARKQVPSADSNWEQRNDLKSPSLEDFSAPQTLSDTHVGLGAEHINGGR